MIRQDSFIEFLLQARKRKLSVVLQTIFTIPFFLFLYSLYSFLSFSPLNLIPFVFFSFCHFFFPSRDLLKLIHNSHNSWHFLWPSAPSKKHTLLKPLMYQTGSSPSPADCPSGQRLWTLLAVLVILQFQNEY